MSLDSNPWVRPSGFAFWIISTILQSSRGNFATPEFGRDDFSTLSSGRQNSPKFNRADFRSPYSITPDSDRADFSSRSSSRGQYLESLNEKCNRESVHNQQSYIRSYCFQYNTLSNIHYLLSFGEELLQIGPIDLIYLKSDLHSPSYDAHPKHTPEKPPLIIYPENSSETLNQSQYERSKLDRYPSLRKTEKVQLSNEKVGITNERRQKAMGYIHNETKREVSDRAEIDSKSEEGQYYMDSKGNSQEISEITDDNSNERNKIRNTDYYLPDEMSDASDYIEDLENNEDIEEMKEKTQIDKSVTENYPKRNGNSESAITEVNINRNGDGKEKMKYLSDNIGDKHENIKNERTNVGNVIEHKDGFPSGHQVENKDTVQKQTSIAKQSRDKTNDELFEDTDTRLFKFNGGHHQDMPGSRALRRNLGSDSKDIQMLKKKEETYFLNDDEMNSSVEDMDTSGSFEVTTIRHLPIKLSQPIRTKATAKQPFEISNAKHPSNDKHDGNYEIYERDDSNQSIEQETTPEPMEARENTDTNSELTTEYKNKINTAQGESANEENSKQVDKNNTNDKTKNDFGTNRPHVANVNEKAGDYRNVVNQTSRQKDSDILPGINPNKQVDNTHHDKDVHENTHNGQEINAAADQFKTTEERGTQNGESTSWLFNLEQIAQRLNEIVSTYGITIPIPDWSEDLPAIIPLDEREDDGKRQKDQSMSTSRRRTNKHHGNKKYMALFPLVAVLKFMVIKALLVPLLIAVLIIKKILILGVIALPYVFSLLRICRNGPGFGLLFGGGGGIGGGGGLGGNQVAANAPYLSAVDTAVDYTAGYGAHGGGFGGGVARWMDRHYPPNMIGGHHGGGKQAGELIDR